MKTAAEWMEDFSHETPLSQLPEGFLDEVLCHKPSTPSPEHSVTTTKPLTQALSPKNFSDAE
jgi:hypothetical protein